MTDYKKLIPHILKWETGSPTGWSVKNVPGDDGGWTVSGLTFNTYTQLALKLLGIKPTFDHFKKLTRAEWEVFIKYFWDRFTLNGAIKSQAISELVVDFAWGSGKAVREIQRTLNKKFGTHLVADNVLGNKTIAAINSVPEKQLFEAITDARIAYYKTLEDYPQFGDGWLNRANDIYNTWIGKVQDIIYNNPIKSIAFFLPFWELYGQ